MNQVNYNVGDVISYNSWGVTRIVKVTDKLEDVKNEMPGFDGIVIRGEEKGLEVWGYDYQITSVTRKVLGGVEVHSLDKAVK